MSQLQRRASPLTHVEPRRRGTTKERGYTGGWPSARALHLLHEPLCRHCRALGRVRVATEVDHILDIATHPELRLDDDNLQSLCKPCHSKKTYGTHRPRPNQTSPATSRG